MRDAKVPAKQERLSWPIYAARDLCCTKPTILFFIILLIPLCVSCSNTKEQVDKSYKSAAKSYSKGDFDPAIKKLEEAVKLNPKDSKSELLLAHAYEAKGRLDSAIKAYRTSLSIDPKQPETHYSLAIIYKSQNKIKEATPQLEEAIKINKDFVAARLALGDIYASQGNKDKAKNEYQRIIDMKPFGVDIGAVKNKLEGLR